MCAIASSRLATTFTASTSLEYSVDQSAAAWRLWPHRRAQAGWIAAQAPPPAAVKAGIARSRKSGSHLLVNQQGFGSHCRLPYWSYLLSIAMRRRLIEDSPAGRRIDGQIHRHGRARGCGCGPGMELHQVVRAARE